MNVCINTTGMTAVPDLIACYYFNCSGGVPVQYNGCGQSLLYNPMTDKCEATNLPDCEQGDINIL